MNAPPQPIMADEPKSRRHFSDILRALLDKPEPDIRLSELLAAFGDRAFGALMLIFAAPNILPLPPGSSSVLGLPLVLIAGQLALGFSILWLPKVVSERSLPRRHLAAFADRLLPYLARTERVLKPRLPIMLGPLGDRLIGIACFTLALILFLPVPFANILPAFGIVAFALGLIEKDGVAVMVGWLGFVASLAIVTMVMGALIVAAEVFFRALFGL